jgi:hypothetical protein
MASCGVHPAVTVLTVLGVACGIISLGLPTLATAVHVHPSHDVGTAPLCPGTTACLHHANCSKCIRAIASTAGMVGPLATPASRDLESAFFVALTTTPACATTATPSTVLTPALAELRLPSSCAHTIAIFVAACQFAEYQCFAGDGACRACLAAVYTGDLSAGETLRSSACRGANASMISMLAASCDRFPRCSLAKDRCSNSTPCHDCLVELQGGDAAAAAAHCSAGKDALLLDDVADTCSTGTRASCTYAWQRCDQDVACRSCLAAMDFAHSQDSVITGGLSVRCTDARQNARSRMLMNRAFDSCPAGIVDNCQSKTVGCIMADPQCAACLNATTARQSRVVCDALLNATGYGVTTACAACPPVVHTINHIVQVTSFIGGVSVLSCLTAITVIVVHGRQRVSMRARIIIGLMIANAIYSSAYVIPMNLLSADFQSCGTFTLSAASIRVARAWWFCGKYSILTFELFMVAASIWALERGARTMPGRVEAALHMLCITGGVAAFLGFYFRCAELDNDG